MALPRKGSRTIVVGGRSYRWLVTGVDSDQVVRLLVEDARAPAQRAIHRFPGVYGRLQHPRVTPGQVATFIRIMRARGWNPRAPGPDRVLAGRAPTALDPRPAPPDPLAVLSLSLEGELPPVAARYPWQHRRDREVELRCDGRVSDVVVGTLLASWLASLEIEPAETMHGSLAKLAYWLARTPESQADRHHPGGLCIPGGVVLRRAGIPLLQPGCCVCLTNWVEWRDLLHDRQPPWNGHDPGGSARCDQQRVRFSCTEGAREVIVDTVEYRALVGTLHRQIERFHDRVREWLQRRAGDHTAVIAAALAAYLHLTP